MHRIERNMEGVLIDAKICLMALKRKKEAKDVIKITKEIKIIDIKGLDATYEEIEKIKEEIEKRSKKTIEFEQKINDY